MTAMTRKGTGNPRNGQKSFADCPRLDAALNELAEVLADIARNPTQAPSITVDAQDEFIPDRADDHRHDADQEDTK